MLSFEPVSLQGGTEAKASTNKVAAASESIEKDAVELGIISEVSDKRASPKSKNYAAGDVDENNTLLGLLEKVIPVDMDAGTDDVD